MTETLRLYTRELELQSILEITQAINNNLPEEDLFKIYRFTLRANLNITRLALFVKDKDWLCRVSFGIKNDLNAITFPAQALISQTIEPLSDTPLSLIDAFSEFSLLIPVFHKTQPLAYLLLSLPEDVKADTAFIQTLTNIIMVAIENKRFARNQLIQEAFNRELEIAQGVQNQLFPKNLPQTGNLQVQADYLPNQVVGGDYYDFIQLSEDRFLFCIADASGKGMPAALLMSNFQAALQVLLRQTTDLSDIIRELNFLICKNTGGERFITFFLAMYDRSAKTFSYINAGHNPPVFNSARTGYVFLDKGTMVLGIANPLPFLHVTVFEEVEEFFVFCYTDGLTETTDLDDEQFGDGKLLDFLKNMPHASLAQLHQNLIHALTAYCGDKPFADDITLLSCRVTPEIK